MSGDKITVGNIMNSIGVSIGGNVGGQVVIAGGDITVNGKPVRAKRARCFYCHSVIVTAGNCPHCLGNPDGPNPIEKD